MKLEDIPVVVESGKKYTTMSGVTAIKDGMKASACQDLKERLPKPRWLRVRAISTPNYEKIKASVKSKSLSTVCEEAKCPNIAECWSHGTATLMLMGAICTRACRFCSVDTGNPKGFLDENEPKKAAETVKQMNLDYVVLTSVDRDDLEDGGAAHYARTVQAIKLLSPKTKIEVLTPDFQGIERNIATLLESGIDVFAQNIETVRRLTHPVRDKRAGYDKTLRVLAFAKTHQRKVLTKSSIMLGLGETDEEIVETMRDLRAHQVDILTLGQYLQPTVHHLQVERYVSPEKFLEFRDIGLSLGFFEVASGPMVRSSYRADRVFKKNNLGLE